MSIMAASRIGTKPGFELIRNEQQQQPNCPAVAESILCQLILEYEITSPFSGAPALRTATCRDPRPLFSERMTAFACRHQRQAGQ